MHYRLTTRGVAAHAGSSPEKGRNAVLELAHQIIQAQSLMGWREGLTINAGPITGGSRANIVSDFIEHSIETWPDLKIVIESKGNTLDK
jgi:glutamate carboxypeptidase